MGRRVRGEGGKAIKTLQSAFQTVHAIFAYRVMLYTFNNNLGAIHEILVSSLLILQ